MNTQGNTVLITGGGSGIGFETAKLFSHLGNKVIIVGRNKTKLLEAASTMHDAIPIVCDVTKEEEVVVLINRISNEFPELNILINNAGKAYRYLAVEEDARTFSKAQEELATNFLAPVRLTESFLPLLKKQHQAAVVNISSIVSFAPSIILPTYSATKAALHSFSQTLRLALSQSNVKVFEVLPPLVDTEFAKSLTGNKIPPSEVATAIIKGLEKNEYEIHIGFTATLYQLYLSNPNKAIKALNKID